MHETHKSPPMWNPSLVRACRDPPIPRKSNAPCSFGVSFLCSDNPHPLLSFASLGPRRIPTYLPRYQRWFGFWRNVLGYRLRKLLGQPYRTVDNFSGSQRFSRNFQGDNNTFVAEEERTVGVISAAAAFEEGVSLQELLGSKCSQARSGHVTARYGFPVGMFACAISEDQRHAPARNQNRRPRVPCLELSNRASIVETLELSYCAHSSTENKRRFRLPPRQKLPLRISCGVLVQKRPTRLRFLLEDTESRSLSMDCSSQICVIRLPPSLLCMWYGDEVYTAHTPHRFTE